MIKIDYTSNINLSTKNSIPLSIGDKDDPRNCFNTVNGGLNMKGSC